MSAKSNSKYIGVGVRLVNFGSFTFLSAVACRGWKNGKVPKFAAGRAGFFGISLLCPSMFAGLRVSGNVLPLCEGGDFQH
jgi:hypothetical protein